MIKLKELLTDTEWIRIIVTEEESNAFLQYAKENDCLWSNGNVIHPGSDRLTKEIVAVNQDLLIHCVCGVYDGMFISGKPGYRFSKLMQDVVEDIRIEEKAREKQRWEKLRLEAEERDREFKKKCELNRQISRDELV